MCRPVLDVLNVRRAALTRAASSRIRSGVIKLKRRELPGADSRFHHRRPAIRNRRGAGPDASPQENEFLSAPGLILLPLAILMVASIGGSTSAWVSGSARILFVCGLDRYLPKGPGKVHPRHGSPYVALAMFGLLSSLIIAMSLAGASVEEAYLTPLDLAVALQMISYAYLFAVLLKRAFSRKKRAFSRKSGHGYFRKTPLRLASASGMAITLLGLSMAFVPSRQISSILSFESKMIPTLGVLLAIAWGLFAHYWGNKPGPADPPARRSEAS